MRIKTRNASQALSYFAFTGPDVWIVGDSIVYWAERRAEQIGMTNLGRGAAVHWAGRRGLHLGQVNTLLEQSEGNANPTVLVLHVETNDLESLTKKNLANTLTNLWESQKNKTVVWSSILERVFYNSQSPEAQGKIYSRRRASNRYARALAERRGGKAISHMNINRANLHFYRPDGLHLSNEGLDLFINNLKDGLVGI